jgi:orotate phosphoribosyltransferase
MLEGHFQLSSGLHSSRYIQCALVLQHPKYADRLGALLAEQFADETIDAVVAPALGGIIVAHEAARHLDARALFAERQEGQMRLRRGFGIRPGERVLVVEDVVTTGRSLVEVIELVRQAGGEVVGVGALINRSAGAIYFGVSFRALITINIPVYPPDDCPLCASGVPIMAPGSRYLAGEKK